MPKCHSKYIDTNRPDASALLEKAWQEWNRDYKFLFLGTHLRFGQYFINNCTKGYQNRDIYYETNEEKAYTELLWAICAGELDNKIVSEYTTETNQKGSA